MHIFYDHFGKLFKPVKKLVIVITQIMTWKNVLSLMIGLTVVLCGAPFIELNTVHQAHSEF